MVTVDGGGDGHAGETTRDELQQGHLGAHIEGINFMVHVIICDSVLWCMIVVGLASVWRYLIFSVLVLTNDMFTSFQMYTCSLLTHDPSSLFF